MAKKMALVLALLLLAALLVLDTVNTAALRTSVQEARAAADNAAQSVKALEAQLAARDAELIDLRAQLSAGRDQLAALQTKVTDLERRPVAGPRVLGDVLVPGAPIQVPLPGVQQRDVQGLMEFLGPDMQAAVDQALKDAGTKIEFPGGHMTIRINGMDVRPVPPPPKQPAADKDKEKEPGNF